MTEYIVKYLCVSAGVLLGIVIQRVVSGDYVLPDEWLEVLDIALSTLVWPIALYVVPKRMIMNWRRSHHKCAACGALFKGSWSEARSLGWTMMTWADGKLRVSCPECDFHNVTEPRER